MEFYGKSSSPTKRKGSFQFPTGWNSTIYEAKKKASEQLFQFPTGWNSTVFKLFSISSFLLVSIPNRMEFYKNSAHWKYYERRFNSQRDGILLWLRFALALVSLCFNSQRDGILPSIRPASLSASKFQFPTGWNSTLGLSEEEYAKGMFQFPTGWNSTLTRHSYHS